MAGSGGWQGPAHEAAVAARRRHTDSGGLLVTSDYVLDEMITRLFARRPFAEARAFCSAVFAAQETGMLTVERVTVERFEKAYKLRLRYRDKPSISFTDLTSFTIMHELGIRQVMTGEAHFVQAQFGFRKLP